MNIYKYVCGLRSQLPKVVHQNHTLSKSLIKTQYLKGGSRQSLKVFGSKRMRSL